jgi:hypothetical protein
VYSLSVKELKKWISKLIYLIQCCFAYFSDDLRWLSIVNGFEILLHGGIVITFLVQEIAIFSVDDVLLGVVDSKFLCKVDG